MTAYRLLILGYPIWWLLGVQMAMWPICAFAMLLWLVRNRARVRYPSGMGIWFAFLAWIVVSAAALDGPRYLASFAYRGVLYVSVTVVALYVWNALAQGVMRRHVIQPLVVLWTYAVIGGYLGILAPGVEFTSAAEILLPQAISGDAFIQAIVHPRLGTFDALYDVPRPTALFSYTNDWGAAMGVLTPIALYWQAVAHSRTHRIGIRCVLVASAVPIVVSVNRGLWVSLLLVVGWVAVRRLFRGDLSAILGMAAAGAALMTALAVTPLGDVVQGRLDNANVSTRENLYEASIQYANGSPLWGYGAPQSSEGIADSNDASVGTHGQAWTVLVSQGYVGLGLYVGALLWMLSRSIASCPRARELWLESVGVVVLAQGLVYSSLPVPLAVAWLALVALVAAQPPVHPSRDAPAMYRNGRVNQVRNPV